MTIGVFVATAMMTGITTGEEVKFTRDQCRVLQQIGVNTDGICPPVREVKRPPKQVVANGNSR
jgi:hypothetical protein